MIPLHVVAASIALLAGWVAIVAVKGGRVHRRSGTVFVYSMMVMAASGAILGALHSTPTNVIAGSLTFYLVLTAFLTVRRPANDSRWIDGGVLAMALALVAFALRCAIVALGSPGGKVDGVPSAIFFVFGSVTLLGALGDARVLVSGPLQGAGRLARHLWRMCFALWIATASFFLGSPKRLPPFLRHSPLRPIPVLLVIAVMLFWLVRVRIGQRYRRPVAMALPAGARFS